MNRKIPGVSSNKDLNKIFANIILKPEKDASLYVF